jgi:hypothetical protein
MRRLSDPRFRRNFIALVITWIIVGVIFGCLAWALFAILTYAIPYLKLTDSLTPFVIFGMLTSWQLIEVAEIDTDED